MLMKRVAITLLSLSSLCSATPRVVVEEQLDPRSGCTANNIIRALANPEKSAGASAYCSTYIRSTESVLATTTVTSTTQVPGKTVKVTSARTTLTLYPTDFGTVFFPQAKRSAKDPPFTDLVTYPPSKISSACSCFLTTQPPAATQTTGTSTIVQVASQPNKKITTTITVYQTTRVVPTPQCPGASVPTPGSKAYPLRVEGFYGPSFEGTLSFNPVYSTFGNVTIASGGPALCDGTNGGVNTTPGNTALNTLYNAAVACPLYLNGIYDSGRHEFYITEIGPDPPIPDFETWLLLIDYQLALSNACDVEITPANDVVWAWQDISKPVNYYLKLTASSPTVVAVGKTITFHVIDGRSGMAMEGASVADTMTDAAGNAVFTCVQDGLYGVKADMPQSIRSNRVYFYCYTPGSGHYIL